MSSSYREHIRTLLSGIVYEYLQEDQGPSLLLEDLLADLADLQEFHRREGYEVDQAIKAISRVKSLIEQQKA